MHVHSIKTFLSLIGRLLSKKEVRGQTERVLATHVDCNKISSLCLQLEKLNQIFTQRVFQPNICVEGNILQQCPVSPVSRVQWPENIPAISSLPQCKSSSGPQSLGFKYVGLLDFPPLSFRHGENYYKWSKQFDQSQLLFIMHDHLLGCGFLEASNDVGIQGLSTCYFR